MKKRIFCVLSALLLLLLVLCGCTAREAAVTSITLDVSGARTYFFSDDTFTAEGLKVTASCEDGSTRELSPEDFTVTAPALAPYGDKEVTVTCGEASASYTIHCAHMTSGEEARGRAYTLAKGVTLTAYTVGENKPFVMICPGGGYTMVAETVEGGPYAERINELGYNAFVLRYTTGTDTASPLLYKPLDDLALAMRFVLDNGDFLGVDTSDYAVCGSSAGGHLAAIWSTKELGYEKYGLPRPRTAILVYAVTHMREGRNANLLGEQPPEELRLSMCADLQADGDYPSVYGWAFVEDPLCGQSREMEARLEELGVEHLYRYFTGGEHGLGLAKGTEAEGWLDEAVQFWRDSAKDGVQ